MMNNYAQPVTVGRQHFDGLGRPLSIECGGRATEYHYTAGQLQPTHNILADGKRVDFRYLKALENLVEQILPAGEGAHGFSYDRTLGITTSASGPLGVQQMTFTTAGKPKTDTWTVDGQTHVTTWRYSLGGLLLGFEDAAGVDHQRAFDSAGRLQRITVASVTSEIGYDAFSRPHTYTTHDTVSGTRLTQTLSYDGLGREHTRTYVAVVEGQSSRKVQTLTYTDLDQLESRRWDDGSVQGEERFTYDRHGRLHTYEADPAVAPKDPFGNLVVKQVFRLDALDCYIDVVSTFADNSSDSATFEYANSNDPTQVTRIVHTHASWPGQIDLAYDARGRLERDSLGRVLAWDGQDRLQCVSYQGQTCTYGYDPSGNLCDRRVDEQLTRSFHSANSLTHELRGEEQMRLICDAGQLFAVDRLAAGVHRATLLGCDAQGSVRLEAGEQLRQYRYTAHGGDAGTTRSAANPFGFAGERREPLTGWYIAAGYRPYDPVLMIFLAPDSASPFGRGGLNPYTYCGGDPVNRHDPDGHSWFKWVALGFAVAAMAIAFAPFAPALGAALVAGTTASAAGIGLGGTVAAAGLAFGITASSTVGALGAVAAVASVVKFGTLVAGLAITAKNPDSKAAKILGYVELGAGVIGAGASIGVAGIKAYDALKSYKGVHQVLNNAETWLKPFGQPVAAFGSALTTVEKHTAKPSQEPAQEGPVQAAPQGPVADTNNQPRQIGPREEQAAQANRASLPASQRAETGPSQRVSEIISRAGAPSLFERRRNAGAGDTPPVSRQFH